MHTKIALLWFEFTNGNHQTKCATEFLYWRKMFTCFTEFLFNWFSFYFLFSLNSWLNFHRETKKKTHHFYYATFEWINLVIVAMLDSILTIRFGHHFIQLIATVSFLFQMIALIDFLLMIETITIFLHSCEVNTKMLQIAN